MTNLGSSGDDGTSSCIDVGEFSLRVSKKGVGSIEVMDARALHVGVYRSAFRAVRVSTM